jgi:hypothetical protein
MMCLLTYVGLWVSQAGLLQWFPTFSDSRTDKISVGVCGDRNPVYLVLYSTNNGQKIKLLLARLNMFIFN